MAFNVRDLLAKSRDVLTGYGRAATKGVREFGSDIGQSLSTALDSRRQAEETQRLIEQSNRTLQASKRLREQGYNDRAAALTSRMTNRIGSFNNSYTNRYNKRPSAEEMRNRLISGGFRTGLTALGATAPVKSIVGQGLVGGGLNLAFGDKSQNPYTRFGEGAGSSLKYTGLNRITTGAVSKLPKIRQQQIANLPTMGKAAFGAVTNVGEDLLYNRLAENRGLTGGELILSAGLPVVSEFGGSLLRAIRNGNVEEVKIQKNKGGFWVDQNGHYHDPITQKFVSKPKEVELAKLNQQKYQDRYFKTSSGEVVDKQAPRVYRINGKDIPEGQLDRYLSEVKSPDLEVAQGGEIEKRLASAKRDWALNNTGGEYRKLEQELLNKASEKNFGQSTPELGKQYAQRLFDQMKSLEDQSPYKISKGQIVKGRGAYKKKQDIVGDFFGTKTQFFDENAKPIKPPVAQGGESLFEQYKNTLDFTRRQFARIDKKPLERIIKDIDSGKKITMSSELSASGGSMDIPELNGKLLDNTEADFARWYSQNKPSVAQGGVGDIPAKNLLNSLSNKYPSKGNVFDFGNGVTVELKKTGNNEVFLEKIISADKGKGYGSKALDSLLKEADANGITIKLEPGVIGKKTKGALTKRQLERWYYLRDFYPDGDLLTRIPKSLSPSKGGVGEIAPHKLDPKSFGVTKSWDGKTLSVQAEPTPKTQKDITFKQKSAEKKLANQEYKNWQRSLWSKEGAKLTPRGNLNRQVKNIGDTIKSSSPPSGVNPEKMKDISGFKSYFRDVYRNFRDVFGDGYKDVKRTLLDPFDKAKGNLSKTYENWANRIDNEVVKKYGIKKGSQESADVQLFGEGKINEPALISKYGTKKAKQIVEADQWFRKEYDKLLSEVNSVMKQIYPNNPDKIIPKRKDYYRHFQEMAQGVRGLLNIFDSPANISSSLSGISEYTKPKSKWLSFAQRRTGDQTEYDAVGGFLDYVKAAEYQKNIDPFTARFRALADDLATATAEGSGKEGQLNGFIEYLHDFSNDLAGKTNPADRFIQKIVPGGRKAMRVLDWVNNRVKANVILGNLSSSVAQIFNVPQGIADAGIVNSTKGLGATVANIFDETTPIKESNFIKERYGGGVFDRFDSGMVANGKKFAAWITGALDEVGTKYIWNAEYHKALSEGIEDAVKYADDKTRSLVAGRGIGEVPLIQKSKMTQLLAPFQLEVSNLWHVMGDWVGEKKFGKLVTFFIASHVFNRAAQNIRGSDVSLDPIQASIEAYNAYQEEEDKGIGALRAGGRLAGEVLSNTMGGQSIASIYPEYGGTVGDTKLPTRRDLFGEGDPTRFGSGLLASQAITDPLYKLIPPYGGQQIKRTLEGVKTVNQGYGTSKSGRVQTTVDQTPTNYLKGATFGKYSLPEYREYFDKDRSPLGEKQSEFVKSQGNKASAYEGIISDREKRAREDKLKERLKQDGQSGVVGNTYMYYKNGEVNSVNTKEVSAMPSQTNLQRKEKEKETYKAVKEIMKSTLKPEEKDQALQELGVSKSDANYYSIASRDNDEKYAFVQDVIEKNQPKSSGELVKMLVPMIYEVNGDKILSSGVIDKLYDDGLISKSDKKYLNSLYTEGTKVKRKGGSGGSGKSAVTNSQLLKAYSDMLEAMYGIDNKQKKSQSYKTFGQFLEQKRRSYSKR